jgi:hypothetical protein
MGASTSPKPFNTILAPLLGQGFGDAQADAAGGAGDESSFAFEHGKTPKMNGVEPTENPDQA